MRDCHKDMTAYHDEKVALAKAEQDAMRDRRNANRDQMTYGLKRDEEPELEWHQSQGSYAMWTMIQHPDNDYDIDDGVYFKYEDLKGPKGGERSPSDVKKMVLKAVDKSSFKSSPEALKNCVRVYYNDGSHIDIPIYRIREDENGNEYYELASTIWTKSDPAKVTQWFREENQKKSPDGLQLRWIVRLLKNFSRDQEITGFMISKLVVEKYQPDVDRLDRALYNTMVAIRDRLKWDTTIKHPVIDGENLTKENDKRPEVFRDKLEKAIDNLLVLFKSDCSDEDAAKAWNKVFKTDFFSMRAKKNKDAKSQSYAGVGILRGDKKPEKPVNKEGGGRNA